MTTKKPEKLDEFVGDAMAGAKRFAQRQGAMVANQMGMSSSINVQDARAVIAREFGNFVKNEKAGGSQIAYTYANLSDFLKQRYNYVPDDKAQAAIMQFMKTAGKERLPGGDEETIGTGENQIVVNVPQTWEAMKYEPTSQELIKLVRERDTLYSKEGGQWKVTDQPKFDAITKQAGEIAKQVGKRIKTDPRAVWWTAQQMVKKEGAPRQQQQQQQQQNQNGGGGQGGGLENTQQSPGDAHVQAQHPNNQGNHPMQESFEILARRLLEAENDFAFAAAALLLEDASQGQDLYQRAVATVRNRAQAGSGVTTAYLQNDLKVPYRQAAELMQQLEQNGVVSEVDPQTKLRKVLPPNDGGAAPNGQGGQNGEAADGETQPDQEAENQAQQAAEQPGATHEPEQPSQAGDQSQMNARDASASRWKNSIEPGMPNKDAPLNRSQFDKLTAIIAADMVRRDLFSYGKGRDQNGVIPPDKDKDGDDSMTTSSGSRFDMKKFEKTLADASVQPEEIADILKKAKNSENIQDAEKRIMGGNSSRQAAAALAAAFGRAFKPSANFGKK
jgi:hypothetical protein